MGYEVRSSRFYAATLWTEEEVPVHPFLLQMAQKNKYFEDTLRARREWVEKFQAAHPDKPRRTEADVLADAVASSLENVWTNVDYGWPLTPDNVVRIFGMASDDDGPRSYFVGVRFETAWKKPSHRGASGMHEEIPRDDVVRRKRELVDAYLKEHGLPQAEEFTLVYGS